MSLILTTLISLSSATNQNTVKDTDTTLKYTTLKNSTYTDTTYRATITSTTTNKTTIKPLYDDVCTKAEDCSVGLGLSCTNGKCKCASPITFWNETICSYTFTYLINQLVNGKLVKLR